VTLARLPEAKAFAKDVFINHERKLKERRRLDTALVSTLNDANHRSVELEMPELDGQLSFHGKPESLGSGGSLVAKLKLKGIDGKAPPGVEPAA
jgi:hypothetical protein